MKKTIHYLGYYVADAQREKLNLFPSCFSKIEYIADKLEALGANVKLVSMASARKGNWFCGMQTKLSPERSLRYFSSFAFGGGIGRKLNVMWLRVQLLLYILFCVKKQDVLLVYHSLFYAPVLKLARKYFGKKFILEIEDVYSSVTEEAKKFKEQEWDFFEYADSYLCVNDILAKKLPEEKTKITSYGNYNTYPKLASADEKKIRLVYAGIIERKREAVFLALESMHFLDERYCLDIMGFGADEDVEEMLQCMRDLNAKKGYECVRYLGMLTGDAYYQALQKGRIALSTHKYTEQNMESADYTFPSKMLVYLANDLRIVAQQLECLTCSELGAYLTFYESPEPKAIAQAIKEIDVQTSFDGASVIRKMDVVFLEKFAGLLDCEALGE